jgi:ribonuclease Z
VYSYAEGDTTYFGCVHKVFRAEIDLAPHLDRPRADVYGAWKMRRDALAPCRVAVAEAYSFRYSFRGCVNPTFRQDPADYTPEAVRQLVEGSPETPCWSVDLRLVFLGTAGAVPTVDRAPSALLIIRGGERILVDCGEGTQRQLMRSVGLGRIDTILITHLHGDHYLGLPGLLKTLSLQGRSQPLSLYGPVGLTDIFQIAQRMFGRFQFPVLVHEVGPGTILEQEGYVIRAAENDHGLAGLAWSLEEEWRPGLFHPERAVALGVRPGPYFGRLQVGESLVLPSGVVVEPEQVMDDPRPGRKVVVTGDTRPSPTVAAFSTGAAVLVHDATFTEEERARALETRHSTALEAAQVAREAGVGLLALTHLSSRHSRRELTEEARRVFPNSVVPSDLDHVIVPYPEKGVPELVGRAAVAEREGAEWLGSVERV